MTDFGQLKVKKQDSQKYVFWNIVGEPVLIVKHAGESNKDYFNEMLRRAEHVQKRRQKLSVELIRDNRNRDRELYPKFIVIGWEKVVDAKGDAVPFSMENCNAFLKAIDDDEFDGLREFCREAANFRVTGDPEGAAGNSPTA